MGYEWSAQGNIGGHVFVKSGLIDKQVDTWSEQTASEMRDCAWIHLRTDTCFFLAHKAFSDDWEPSEGVWGLIPVLRSGPPENPTVSTK